MADATGAVNEGRTAEVPLVQPVATRVVRQEWAERVVSPAYDAMRPDDRRKLMETDPYVFLHVTRSPGDDAGPVADSLAVASLNAEALHRLIDADLFTEVAEPGMYLYRLRLGDHEQVAVVADVALAGLADGRIGPHERTRPHRTVLLADHLETVQANSSPVAFGYRDDPEVDAIVARTMEREPILDFEREDHLGQTVWRLADDDVAIVAARLSAQKLYIVDGHHRVSAGAELWQRSGHDVGVANVLGAIFPMSRLRVSSFHRRVVDTNGLSVDELCDAVAAQDFSVTPLAVGEDPHPDRPGAFGLYVAGQWYRMQPFRRHPAEFDATVIQQRVLEPILGVDEAGSQERLQYLPGDQGLDTLVSLVDAEGGVGFALHPVPLPQLMAVVDRGMTLPPKSTYFEPKVRSGVFVTPRVPKGPAG